MRAPRLCGAGAASRRSHPTRLSRSSRAAFTVIAITVCAGCSASARLSLRVAGNRLVDGQGHTVRLLGVNRSGAEYSCVGGLGLLPGPTDNRAIAAMVAWRINAVRIPLNEDCWLGINGVPFRYRGAPYRAAIRGYVTRLHRAGLYVILDLHWNAPGTAPATGQRPMADLDHAPMFWSSVASEFEDDPAIAFDVYNEPNDIGWRCWRDGCSLPTGWTTAGMQRLVDAVRASGARQPIIATGLGSGNDLSSWLEYRPHDPANQLVAGFHVYDSLPCDTTICWNHMLRPIARHVPVIASEFGERDCSYAFVDRFMSWADAAGVSYLAWAWNPFGCDGPGLIRSWDGQPTGYGVGLHAHLIGLRRDRHAS